MEPPHGEQYSQEGNPRAYMTMRDYRNLAWQNQQPLGRNPNPNRSMRDYRDQWMSAPVYSVPSTYPPPPQYDQHCHTVLLQIMSHLGLPHVPAHRDEPAATAASLNMLATAAAASVPPSLRE